MMKQTISPAPGRRTVLRAALAVGAANLAPPFILSARGQQPVLI